MCLINNNKIFPKVKYDAMIKTLKDISIDGEDLNIMFKNVTRRRSSAVVKIKCKAGNYGHSKQVVRQGYEIRFFSCLVVK